MLYAATKLMQFVYDDGGRTAAGYKGKTGDCVCRAVAITLERLYHDVYVELTELGWMDRPYVFDTDGLIRPRSDTMAVLREYMAELGWRWMGHGGVLHAKAIVADDEAVFVTSANLTEAALDRNIEAGLLVRDRALAASVSSHFQRLIDRGLLHPLPTG
jgi:phosphatidylserine/phosphatidylglycerophosphate/cardiolipin synthase-like enzyme